MNQPPSRRADAFPPSRAADLVRILQAATAAANLAPGLEDALRAALRSLCFECGWAGARLVYGTRAPLSVRHVEDRARISGHRGVWDSAFPPAPEELWHDALVTARAHAAGSVLVFPILEGGEAVGVVEATAHVRPVPVPELVETLRVIGTEVGLIAERKRVEEELRRKRAHSEALLEHANAVVVSLDMTGAVTLFNRAAEVFTGWPRAEVLGRSWFEVLAPRARYPQLWDAFHKLASATMVHKVDAPLLARDGSEKHLHWRCSRIDGPEGPSGTLWIGTEPEAYRRMEADLRERTPIPIIKKLPAEA